MKIPKEFSLPPKGIQFARRKWLNEQSQGPRALCFVSLTGVHPGVGMSPLQASQELQMTCLQAHWLAISKSDLETLDARPA